ncbi:MAG TPA: elongation factor EF-2 [Acidobacteriota bacterium]|nr:elongation factor EF-2 [Acidobacteriota bacterium]
MATDKMVDRVQRIIKNPDQIRNICTSAHIHHGKTAFTDNLLAASGQMAAKFAGDLEQGMATWQHADEQERLMTVDAANVSMVHEYNGKEFLINLIDTPGHVDFGGNVTRAMRAIDGTIVLVCAVEGFMPQTETVLRQALKERVKPILFINKVDRLIKEVKMTPESMQARFMEIFKEFNQMIDKIAEPEFAAQWKVDILNGSVAFGSARDNWAMSVPFMKKKGVSFKDVLNIYELDEQARKDWCWKNAPLFEVILDMVVGHLPTPQQAQRYRIPKIWHGDLESDFGKDLITCNTAGKPAFCITRIVIDPRSGKEISAGRLFSGKLADGMEVYLNLAKKRQRIHQVLVYNGIKPEPVGEITGGNVLAITGVVGEAGETITLNPETPFEELKHIFDPVITKAIKVKNHLDLPKLVEVLQKVAKEDPSVKVQMDQKTGENLLSGMGELHLEIIEGRIKTEKGVEVETSNPIIIYRESITKASPEYEGKSPNKHNKFYFRVEPVEPSVVEAMSFGKLTNQHVKGKDLALRQIFLDAGYETKQADAVKAIYNGNLFIDETRGQIYMMEVIEMLLETFEDVMNNGPVAREPCFGVKVIMTDMKLHEDAIHRGPAQVYPAVREGIRGAMVNAGPTLFEPQQILLIEVPNEYMGEISKLVSSKRGQLLDMTQSADQANIKAKMPVMELLGWSSDLRSATSGRGISSLVDQSFERLPNEIQGKVRQQIMQRKGLNESQVGI